MNHESMEIIKKYPFKFLDAYGKEDKDIFFGREEEVDELYRLVFQTNLLLVYGASGTGKTSLIRCGLANRFKPSQWLDLYIRRGADINQSLLATIRNHTPQTAPVSEEPGELDWFESMLEAEKATGTPAVESPVLDTDNPIAQALHALYLATFTPIYLIFDQFEELYTLGQEPEQLELIRTMAELVQLPLPLKIIVVMREEYLANLYELEKAVPQLRNKKLRIEPMDLPRVEAVILNATARNPHSNVELETGRETAIAKSIIEKIREQDVNIKLPYLQIFMDRLYETISGEATDRSRNVLFTLNLVNAMKEIGDVLADFIERQSQRTYRELAQRYKNLPIDIIWKILSPFATVDGTKAPLRQEALSDLLKDLELPAGIDLDDLIKTAISELESGRILRYRKEERTYEVMHDVLAKVIAEKRGEEEKAFLKAKRLVSERYKAFEDTRTILSREELAFIKPYKAQLARDLTADHQDFITRSRNQRWWQRFGLWSGIAIAFAVAIGVILIVRSERQEAEDALNNFLAEQAEKMELQFNALEDRATIILDVGGCPMEILKEMQSLASEHPDSLEFYQKIDSLYLKNPACR